MKLAGIGENDYICMYLWQTFAGNSKSDSGQFAIYISVSQLQKNGIYMKEMYAIIALQAK